jgi:hypothetical protein
MGFRVDKGLGFKVKGLGLRAQRALAQGFRVSRV